MALLPAPTFFFLKVLCQERQIMSLHKLLLDPFVIIRSRKLNPRVTLNVGGERHDVMWTTLQRIQRSRLYRLSQAKTHQEILVNFHVV